MTPRIALAPPGFADWAGLHDLLARAFAFMEGRIDPPSSLALLTPDGLARKARAETLLLALDDGRPVACAFLAEAPPALDLGKIAVDPDVRRRGLLRQVVAEADRLARARGLTRLELQSRVELAETHAAFAALGFARHAETAHPGYDRPTSVTFRRAVDA